MQDSDELWTLSPPARRSLETLLRNSSDASVRTSGNIFIAGLRQHALAHRRCRQHLPPLRSMRSTSTWQGAYTCCLERLMPPACCR